MASVGNILATPESGMKRIDDKTGKINYVGSWIREDVGYGNIGYYNDTSSVTKDTTSTCVLYVYTSNFYVVGQVYNNRSKNIEITIDDNVEYYSGYSTTNTGISNYVQYVTTLEKKIHKVVIRNTTSSILLIDAFDIDEDGFLLTEEEFNNYPFYLIKNTTENKYYNYDKTNSSLIEITDTSILNEVANLNTCIIKEDLGTALSLMDLTTNNVTLISNVRNKITVRGLKQNVSMVVTIEPISLKRFEAIRRVTSEGEFTGSGNAKFVFSFDGGESWKTYDVTNSLWEDVVDINIPIKLYENFKEEDKINWNNAKDKIINEGVDISDISSVNFNVEDGSMMIAVVILRDVCSDRATLKSLNLVYDSLKRFAKMNNNVEIGVCGNTIEIIPSLDCDTMVVNMVTNI